MMQFLKRYQKLPNWFFLLPAMAIKFAKKFIFRTEIIDLYDNMHLEKLPFITVTWHNRLLLFPAMFPKEYRVRTKALISPSRDGQYIADLIKFFDVDCIRGSSFKHGALALKKCKEALKKGYNISITPDGPRGPKYKMSNGPIILSSITGVPVIPVSVNSSSYWELNSWDNFQIQKPFSKVNLVIGKPEIVPANLQEDELEEWRRIVEKNLNDISFMRME